MDCEDCNTISDNTCSRNYRNAMYGKLHSSGGKIRCRLLQIIIGIGRMMCCFNKVVFEASLLYDYYSHCNS